MYIDQQAELSDAQAVTATAISSNVCDLRGNNLGAGLQATLQNSDSQGPVYLVVSVPVLAVDASSERHAAD